MTCQLSLHRDDRLAFFAQLIAEVFKFHIEMCSTAVFADVRSGQEQFSERASALDTSFDTASPLLQPFLHDELEVVPQKEKAQEHGGVPVEDRQIFDK